MRPKFIKDIVAKIPIKSFKNTLNAFKTNALVYIHDNRFTTFAFLYAIRIKRKRSQRIYANCRGIIVGPMNMHWCKCEGGIKNFNFDFNAYNIFNVIF